VASSWRCGGAAPASLSRFAVGYVGPDGRSRLDNLVDAAGVAFETVRPVRPFPAYRGQRHNTGLWWSAPSAGQYRLVHEPDPVVMANVRWLAGYRHPRCLRPALAAAVFAEAGPLMDGAALLGDPLANLPTVFHLLWCGLLRADLAVPLSESSLVTAVRR
jgi:hypothetical protein